MDTSVQNALAQIFKPVSDAVDGIVQANQATVNGLNQQLAAQGSQIQALQDQLANQPVPLPGTQDANLHVDWKIGTGGSIAPLNAGLVQDVDFGFKQLQSKSGSPATAIELYFNRAVLGDYSGFLVALHRDIAPAAAKLFWRGRFFHDDRATNGMQALEFDTRLSKDNLNYNLSSQINYAKGGVLQIVNDASGNLGWQDTPIILGKPAANVWHEYQWEYWYDTVSKTFGYTAFTFDGKRYPISGVFTSQKATAPDWGKPFRIHTQLQIGTTNKGLPFGVAFDRLSYFTQ